MYQQIRHGILTEAAVYTCKNLPKLPPKAAKNNIYINAKAHFCISEFLRALQLFHAAEYPALRRLYRGKHAFAAADYCAYTRKHIFGPRIL